MSIEEHLKVRKEYLKTILPIHERDARRDPAAYGYVKAVKSEIEFLNGLISQYSLDEEEELGA